VKLYVGIARQKIKIALREKGGASCLMTTVRVARIMVQGQRKLTAALLLLTLALLGCSNEPTIVPDGNGTDLQKHLEQTLSERDRLAQELQTVKAEQAQTRSERDRLTQELQAAKEELASSREAIKYLKQLAEVTASVIYEQLTERNHAAVLKFAKSGSPFEAGFNTQQFRTFKQYESVTEVDFVPFFDYAAEHPLSSAEVKTHTRRSPQYVTVSLVFPDGTYVHMMLGEGYLIKLEISDQDVLANA
jgi:outer membrane murein-binding lipoprotein Lpp